MTTKGRDPIARLAMLMGQRDAANKLIAEHIEKSFPIGARAEWEWAGAIYSGSVELVGYDRVKVRNSRTSKTRWISAWNLVQPAVMRHEVKAA